MSIYGIYWKIPALVKLLQYCWQANHLITSIVNVFSRTQLEISAVSCNDIKNDQSNFYFNAILKYDDIAISKLAVSNYNSVCHARHLGSNWYCMGHDWNAGLQASVSLFSYCKCILQNSAGNFSSELQWYKKNDQSNFYFNAILKYDDIAISKLAVSNYNSVCHARYLGSHWYCMGHDWNTGLQASVSLFS